MPFWDFLRRRSGRGRPPHEPKRDTLAWPNLSTLGQASPQAQRVVYKPVPKNLRFFSRTPIARRAINEVEGEGKIPIIGTELVGGSSSANKARGPNVLKLYAEGDKALYLAYQEFLRTEIAAGFDLCNMALNLERDVNRSTAEVQEDRDWLHAIRPMAFTLAAHWTREAIWGCLGFYSLQFRWKGLDRKDEKSECDVLSAYYDRNVFTANQIRDKLGEPPLEDTAADWGNMLKVDVEIAINAARGSKVVDDPDLKPGNPATNPPAPAPATPPENKDA